MITLNLEKMTLAVDFLKGEISSLKITDKERISAPAPLFRFCVREKGGEAKVFSAYDAAKKCEEANFGTYLGFGEHTALYVKASVASESSEAVWSIELSGIEDGYAIEWVDYPFVFLPSLKAQDECGGRILYPFNEGAIVEDIDIREKSFKHKDPEYPSEGSFSVFPNMICSQFIAYLFDDVSLYFGAHDAKRGFKGIDFFAMGEKIAIELRHFTGVSFGEDYKLSYPVVIAALSSSWQSAAERYRTWFEANLPPRVKKIKENSALPSWYEDSPLVVTYPVRGKFDTDVMEPNAYFPYLNAYPEIKNIKEKTGARIMALLMHWEGTAPWAPPYVWPPYGGEQPLFAFRDALHSGGDLLGLYCSGFGYTTKSNLIDTYDMSADYEKKNLALGMCKGPDGRIEGKICRAQRDGYDICPASEVGRKLLLEAYTPLFNSGLDYVQILDQNHGGGQYLCYSKEHGHPPMPGAWMTENMQEVLGEWNDLATSVLFGCESAAAEPFLGNLLFSDNRFELNYFIGEPVPLYAYLYHEYIRNFMGNQVCCPFVTCEDSLCYRLAYSFIAGDSMTLVLSPDGKLLSHWGSREFEKTPDKERALTFIKNLTDFYNSTAKKYLFAGKMIESKPYKTECREYILDKWGVPGTAALNTVLSSAWEAEDGTRAQIFVNCESNDERIFFRGEEVCVPALSAISIKIQ